MVPPQEAIAVVYQADHNYPLSYSSSNGLKTDRPGPRPSCSCAEQSGQYGAIISHWVSSDRVFLTDKLNLFNEMFQTFILNSKF